MDDVLPEYRPPKKSLLEMSHVERMAQLMRSLGTPAAVPIAIAMIRLKERELEEAEVALAVMRRLAPGGEEAAGKEG